MGGSPLDQNQTRAYDVAFRAIRPPEMGPSRGGSGFGAANTLRSLPGLRFKAGVGTRWFLVSKNSDISSGLNRADEVNG